MIHYIGDFISYVNFIKIKEKVNKNMPNNYQKSKKKKASRGTSGIPNWLLSTLVIIVVLAVVGTCVATAVVSSGIPMRLSTAASLDNFKVDGNMMSYFYQTTYMNFMNNYSSYMSYLSFKQNINPKDQEFNPEGSYDSAFLQPSEDYETWFDFFMGETKASVKNLLIYCAEAEKLGITLSDEDKAEIEASIDSLLINIRTSYGAGLSESTCFANVYGNGVSRNDVRKAMELSALASKAAQQISDTLEDAITDERINATYNDNKLDYNLIDYITYSFDVSYDDVIVEKYGTDKTAESLTEEEKAAVLELYTEKIKEAHKDAEELKLITDLNEFRNWIIKYETKHIYDDQFETAMKNVTDEQKPKAAEGEANPLDTIKEKTIEAVIKEVIDGKESVTEDVVTTEADSTKTYTLYGISITAEFAEAAKTLKSKLFSAVVSAKDSALVEKANYIAPDSNGKKDDFSEWAFDEARKANDVANFETGDGSNSAEVKVSTERFTAEVSLLIKTSYRDETLSRNVAYMLYTKEDAAKKALEAIEATEGLTKDKFLEIAEDENNHADAHTYLEDCIIGRMSSDEFDEWLYNAKPGDYTKTAIKMSDNSLMLAYYESEGTIPAWKDTVKGSIYSDDYTAYEKRMNEDFAISVVFNTKVLNKVGA